MEYTLVNYKTKEMIELGKGCWWEFFHAPENLLYREGIREVMEDYDYFKEGQSTEMISYWENTIDLIWNFVKDADPADITIISDSDDSTYVLRSNGYHYIDTRYNDCKEQHMDFLNRHLLNQARYNKDEAAIWIQWTALDKTRL